LNLKAVVLVFLIVFAATATLCLAGILSSQVVDKEVSYTKSRNIMQVGGDLIEPQEEIDTPGMPT
jgi:hypothetical protein